MTTNNPILQLRDVAVAYDGTEVLQQASLSVLKNDFLGIIGPNGGGKTTLVKVMLGLLPPARGEVRYFRDHDEVESLRMGYLPQYSTFDTKFPISVNEVILSGLLTNRRGICCYSRVDRERADELLSLLHLTSEARRSIGELSGGQRQRALIGRALICEPEVLILDEPSTYIDQEHQEQLYELLADINRRCAVVLVSHDIGTVLRNVRNIVCVNRSVHYHPADEVNEELLKESFGCPFQLVAHGHVPHRVLGEHTS